MSDPYKQFENGDDECEIFCAHTCGGCEYGTYKCSFCGNYACYPEQYCSVCLNEYTREVAC